MLTAMKTVHRLPHLVRFAQDNRRQMTESEVRLWIQLRGRVLGVSFRRQHPVGPYILDFACVALRLAIELDGSQHLDSARDAVRDAFLNQQGWTVLRFWSADVLLDVDSIVAAIEREVERLDKGSRPGHHPPRPPSSAGPPASGGTLAPPDLQFLPPREGHLPLNVPPQAGGPIERSEIEGGMRTPGNLRAGA
jgi:very-short-patch-repair endonuclease